MFKNDDELKGLLVEIQLIEENILNNERQIKMYELAIAVMKKENEKYRKILNILLPDDRRKKV